MSEISKFPVPALVSGEIHLWTISIDSLKEQVEGLQSLLSVEEKRRVSFYIFEHTQQSYIVTQAVLRILLSSYLGINPEDVIMGTHKKGKPYLIHEHPIFFNISNSYDLCVYAFSCDAEVGIDIEKIRQLPDIDQLIEKNLTSREKKYFLKEPDNKTSRFLQFWTFKEAYLKAIGEGMRLTPDNLEFSLDDGMIRMRSVNYGFDGADWQFKKFSREGAYTVTLAYTGKETVIRELSAKEMGTQ